MMLVPTNGNFLLTTHLCGIGSQDLVPLNVWMHYVNANPTSYTYQHMINGFRKITILGWRENIHYKKNKFVVTFLKRTYTS